MRTATVLIALVIVIPSVIVASTIHVPADYPTIQQAIDASMHGDVVLVAPGTYVENIDFLGKAVTVKSSQGAHATVIDGGSPLNPDLGSVVLFNKGEKQDSVLEGFAITNGSGTFHEYYPNLQGFCGGGIFCNNASPTIKKNIIEKNETINKGGGVYSEGGSPVIVDNGIFHNVSHNGGGIYCWDSDAVITGNTISHSICSYTGGGIYCEISDAQITQNIITRNFADYRGGGLRVQYDAPLIEDNTIADNASGEGGGISLSSCSPEISGNSIMENTSHFGGAIYSHFSTFTLTGNVISSNVGILGSGGVNGSGEMIGNTIVNNTSGGNVGGAAWGTGIVAHNIIAGNAAYGEDAGGLRCGNATVSANIITGNYAANRGGGVDCNKGSVLLNNVISGNKAGRKGGGIACDFDEAILINNVITKNWAGQNGGGYFSGSHADVDMINTILWNNEAPDGAEINVAGFSTLSIRSSDIEGGQASVEVTANAALNWGSGNIDADPVFAEPGKGDFHLTFQSPCRGSGDNAAPGLPLHDFEGDPRVYQGTVDIGADEFHPHLYSMGKATPGGSVTGKVVGLPGTSPIGLFLSLDVLPSPVPTAWGAFHLQPPLLLVDLPSIPSNGILALPTRIPVSPPAPYNVFMQALIGLSPDSLSNLSVLEVR